jgi:hypothetical protein
MYVQLLCTYFYIRIHITTCTNTHAQLETEQHKQQEELAAKLRDMMQSVSTTARGRCRSDVLAKLGGVAKLKAAIAKHRLAVNGLRETERLREEEQKRKEQEKRDEEARNKEQDALAKAERKTEEMNHRSACVFVCVCMDISKSCLVNNKSPSACACI